MGFKCGIVGLRGGGLRQRIEQRGLAHIRQAHNATFETHGSRNP